jgi:RimJ/RimL family protein N-acetyltransferase
MTQIETERLLLREPQLDDVEMLLDLVGDGEAMRPIGSEPGGRAVALESLERWTRRWEANGMGPFVVLAKGDEKIIGRVGPLVWNARTWENSTLAEAGDDAVVELGWMIASARWGSGYAPEAAHAVRQWVYDTQGVEHLISLIDPANTKSARVAEKLGAEPTETVHILGDYPATIWVHPR